MVLLQGILRKSTDTCVSSVYRGSQKSTYSKLMTVFCEMNDSEQKQSDFQSQFFMSRIIQVPLSLFLAKNLAY